MADSLEEATLTAAEDALERALKLAADMAASRAELRVCVRALAELTRDVVNVATLRLERLDAASDDDD
ncbi:hypothetical protein [Streptomyces sp. CA-106110]